VHEGAKKRAALEMFPRLHAPQGLGEQAICAGVHSVERLPGNAAIRDMSCCGEAH
jgi:hypothetical protein